MFIFGGYDIHATCCSDLYSLNLQTFTWNLLKFSLDSSCKFSFPLLDGLMHHSACISQAVHKGELCMFVFGGSNSASTSNHLFYLKFSTLEFFELKTKNQIEERYAHDSFMCSNGDLCVFGGSSKTVPSSSFTELCFLNFETLQWTRQVSMINSIPKFSKSILVNNGKNNSSIVYLVGETIVEEDKEAINSELQKKVLKFISEEMPNEILIATLSYMTINDLISLSMVSKKWKVSKLATG